MLAVNAGNLGLVKEWVARAGSREEAQERISRIFLITVNTAVSSVQQFLFESNLINFNFADQINERNSIHQAAISGRTDVLRLAVSAGADIRTPDVYGRIPLHYACMHGHVEMIEALVDAAPDLIDAKDLDNFTPLVHGIVHSQAGSVQSMLERGAPVNPAAGSGNHIPINLACQYGSPVVVKQIIQFNPDIRPDAEGLFPQHLVARFGGSREVLRMLELCGVDMNQPDGLYQWTPIFHAASEGHLHCVQQLLDFHVDANIRDEKGLPAMYYAAWEGQLECMGCLVREDAGRPVGTPNPTHLSLDSSMPPAILSSKMDTSQLDPEAIPDLSLPPPIIPLRRYGHSFLDTTKTFIVLSFDHLDSDAIEFYGDSKYPAARLTISSKSSDLIPRSVPLPIQDDSKNISFQIDNVDTFSIDFDIFPTFGSKVIARAAASSRVFTGRSSSSGRWHLELFDPRLRAIGRISFRYQVVTPFHGIPLEITHFATYWKATSQYENHPSNLITGSSLSGDFLRLFVQVTRDGVPVLYNSWSMPGRKHDLISRMSLNDVEVFRNMASTENLAYNAGHLDHNDLPSTQRQLMSSYTALSNALMLLPTNVDVEIHVCYPTRIEEETKHLGPTQNINAIVDAILKVVFDHARHLRETQDAELRNFVFSSYNPGVCTALNWKQPNCKCAILLQNIWHS